MVAVEVVAEGVVEVAAGADAAALADGDEDGLEEPPHAVNPEHAKGMSSSAIAARGCCLVWNKAACR